MNLQQCPEDKYSQSSCLRRRHIPRPDSPRRPRWRLPRSGRIADSNLQAIDGHEHFARIGQENAAQTAILSTRDHGAHGIVQPEEDVHVVVLVVKEVLQGSLGFGFGPCGPVALVSVDFGLKERKMKGLVG
jgi:hypothetical protein